MKLTVDRIEGEKIICENEEQKMISIDKSEAPFGIKEGDCLNLEDGKITIDKEENERRREEIEKLCEDMWE